MLLLILNFKKATVVVELRHIAYLKNKTRRYTRITNCKEQKIPKMRRNKLNLKGYFQGHSYC